MRWNHNLHYHPLVLSAVPRDCVRALDVGCGDGVLTRELRSVSSRVLGLDRHRPSIERARAGGGDDVAYVLGDLRAPPFEPASFDFVASVAALHHVDAELGLKAMAGLVRPGGVVAVIGLARTRSIADVVWAAAGLVVRAFHRVVLRKNLWEHHAPQVWPPHYGYAELRRVAEAVLPGVVYRRHALWRYSLVWVKPSLVHPRDGDLSFAE